MANESSVGQDLLDVPFPEMVQKLGMSIAQAQFALDQTSIQLAQVMSGVETEIPDPENPEESITIPATKVRFNGEQVSMLELGFSPTFYQFVDTIIEVKVSISMSQETENSHRRRSAQASGRLVGIPYLGGGASVNASSVNASYAAKYQYTAEGSSLLRTKLVNVPAPRVLEERIRALIEN